VTRVPMKITMPSWLRRMVARLLLVTMMISAAGLTFGREILEDGPTGPQSVVSTASAAQHDGQSQDSNVANKACDHSCYNSSHFLGQLSEDRSAASPVSARQYVPHVKRLAARDHTENPFRPPRSFS